MGLAEIQKLLAHLYTDGALRERFCAAPAEVCEEFGLDTDEARQLSDMQLARLSFFAESLLGKRIAEVRKLLPLTARSLAGQFTPLFRRHAETFVPSGIKKHRQDALAFTAFLEETARRDGSLPHWVLEVLRYESAWVEAANRRLMVRKFRYHIPSLVRGVARGDVTASVVARPTVVLWFRLSRQDRLRHATLFLAWRSPAVFYTQQ